MPKTLFDVFDQPQPRNEYVTAPQQPPVPMAPAAQPNLYAGDPLFGDPANLPDMLQLTGNIGNKVARGTQNWFGNLLNAGAGLADVSGRAGNPIGAPVSDWLYDKAQFYADQDRLNMSFPTTEAAEYSGDNWNDPNYFVPQGAELLGETIPGMLTRSPAMAAGDAALQSGGGAYGENRDPYGALLKGLVSFPAEKYGMDRVLGPKGKSMLGDTTRAIGSETGTEGLQTFGIEPSIDKALYGKDFMTPAQMAEVAKEEGLGLATMTGGVTGASMDKNTPVLPEGMTNVGGQVKSFIDNNLVPQPQALTTTGEMMPIPQDDGVGDQTTSQMLIGEKGATKSGSEDATYAKQLERGGRSATEIQNTTGWFRNVDNNWVKEIDDSGMGFQSWPSEELADSGRTSGMLTKVIDHPKLFEAYPSLSWTLADIVIAPEYAGDKVQGAYYPETRGASPKITVRAGTMEDALDTISHEIQHNVQAEEKHAGGTYVDSDAGYKKSAHSAKQQGAKQKIIDNQFPLREGERERLEAERQGHVGEIQQGIADFKSGASEETVKQVIDRVRARNQEIGYILGDSEFEVDELSPFEQYQADVGEISARQTEDRRKLTQAERDANVPYDGVENIAHDDLLSESKMTDEQKAKFKKSTGVQHDDVEGKMKVSRDNSWSAQDVKAKILETRVGDAGPTDPWIGPRPESKPADPDKAMGPPRRNSYDGGDKVKGAMFVSPNKREDMAYEDAKKENARPRHKRYVAFSNKVDEIFGKSQDLDAVGDWADGAENTVVNVYDAKGPDMSYKDIRAAAAIKGLWAEQKSVIPFKTEKGGPDSVYIMDTTLDIDDARDAIIDAGLENRTLVPTENGTRIMVFNPGQGLVTNDAMEVLHENIKDSTTSATKYEGQGEFLGDWNSRQKGYDSYKATLEEFIQGGARYTGNDNLSLAVTEALDQAKQHGLFTTAGRSAATDKLRGPREEIAGTKKDLLKGIKEKTNRALAERFDATKRFIHSKDYTMKSVKSVAKDMVKEMRYELSPKNRKASGLGWYGPRVDAMRKKLSDQLNQQLKAEGIPAVDLNAPEHKGLFTAVLAITSDGTKLQDNMKSAMRTYNEYLKGNGLKLQQDHDQSTESMQASLDAVSDLLAVNNGDVEKMSEALLEESTISDWKSKGYKSSGYLADTVFPMSIIMGPKIGAFYANMMGKEDYLTMDRWWSRTVNRMRGDMTENPEPHHFDRMRDAMDAAGKLKKDMTDKQLLEAARKLQKHFIPKANRTGLNAVQDELRKSANMLGNKATKTKDAPFNASDRKFMRRVALEVQKDLKKNHKEDVTIADIQAVMWYFEKRLYAEQGLRDSKSTSFEDEMKNITAQLASGDWTYEKGNKK